MTRFITARVDMQEEVRLLNKAKIIYRFLLFVAKNQYNSIQAEKNIEKICRKYLKDNIYYDYYLNVVDVFSDPELAIENNVYVTPMLVMSSPLPEAYIAGDMSDTDNVLKALRLKD